MSDTKKLSAGQRRLLLLIAKEAVGEWAPVSKLVLPAIAKLPHELVRVEFLNVGYRAMLTPAGNSVVYAMRWL